MQYCRKEGMNAEDIVRIWMSEEDKYACTCRARRLDARGSGFRVCRTCVCDELRRKCTTVYCKFDRALHTNVLPRETREVVKCNGKYFISSSVVTQPCVKSLIKKNALRKTGVTSAELRSLHSIHSCFSTSWRHSCKRKTTRSLLTTSSWKRNVGRVHVANL